MTESEKQELQAIVKRANHVTDSQGVSRIEPLPGDLKQYLVLINKWHLSFSDAGVRCDG